MYQKVLVENNDLKRKMGVSSKHENLSHKSFLETLILFFISLVLSLKTTCLISFK